MALDLDQVFDRIGNLGRYQIILALLLAYQECIHSFHALVVTFTTNEPPWRCVSGSLMCNMTGLFKPGNEFYEYRCDIPTSDWEFHADYTSIVTEWDLVCSKSILGSLGKSLLFPGWILGMLVFGTISDRYGRKYVLFFNMCLAAIAGFVSSFSPTYWFFAVCRFIIGFGVGGSVNASYIMSMEFTGIPGRVFTTGIHDCGWIVGSTFLALIAYVFPKWDHCTMAVSLAGLPMLATWWYITESPRWLLVEGKHDEVKKVIHRIAKSNGREIPKEDIALTYEKPENSKNGNTKDLFRNWNITKTTLIMFLSWFSCSVMSYGIVFASVSIGGDMYLTFGILNLINFAALPLRIWFMHKFGRKQAIIFGLTLAAISGFCLLAIPSDDESTVAIGGRFALFIVMRITTSLVWGGVYLLTGEVFPTMTRNVGLSWCSTMARIGAFVAPLILWLKRIHPGVPMTIMAGVSLIAAFLSIFVKDTLKAATPETVAEIDLQAESRNNNQNEDEKHEDAERERNGNDLTKL